MEININYQGIPLVVNYKYYGKYYPSTHDTPTEYPEIEILKIAVEDSRIDIQEVLTEYQIDEIIELING